MNNFNWNNNLTTIHEDILHGNHYIDKASRKHALSQIPDKDNLTILEIGSSSGYFIRDLKLFYPNNNIIGSDCISESLRNISSFNIPLIQLDLTNSSIRNNSIDIVVALNVLEHIEDDKKALREIYRILKPNGMAIIEVPANPKLYDSYDEYLKHYRRYICTDLVKKSEDIGFEVEKSSHLGVFIYPLFYIIKYFGKKKIPTNKEREDIFKKRVSFGGNILNNIMNKIMNIELFIGKYIQYPFGIRCLITLKKQKHL